MRQIEIGPRFEDWHGGARVAPRGRASRSGLARGRAPAVRARGRRGRTRNAPPVIRVPRAFLTSRAGWRRRDPDRWRVLYEALADRARKPRRPRQRGPTLVKRLHARVEPAPAREWTSPAHRRRRRPARGAGSHSSPARPPRAARPRRGVRDAISTAMRARPSSVGGRPTRASSCGEQPGDQEDRQVRARGPAARCSIARVEVGLARDRLYVTNAVKHF
jgi:hypothetical protein